MPAMSYLTALARISRIRTGSLKDLGDILQAFLDGDNRTPVNVTASATVNKRDHAGRLININAAAGVTLTLPAATGTGDRYRFLIGTTVTSNSTIIKVANATDVMTGLAQSAADSGNTINGWETASTSDTITFDGSTTGGIKGDYVDLEDAASGLWRVEIVSSSTGTEATPFSATVS